MAAALNRTLVIPKHSLLSHFNWSVVFDVRHIQRCLQPHNGPNPSVVSWDEFLVAERRKQHQQQLGPPAGSGREGSPPPDNFHGRRRRRRLMEELNGAHTTNTSASAGAGATLTASQPVNGSTSNTTVTSWSLMNTSLSNTSSISSGIAGGGGSSGSSSSNSSNISRNGTGNITLPVGGASSGGGDGRGGQSKVVLERIVCIVAVSHCWNPVLADRSMASMPELAFPEAADEGMMESVASSLDGGLGRCMLPATFVSLFGGLSERVLSFGNMYQTSVCIDWYRWSRPPLRTACADRVPRPPPTSALPASAPTVSGARASAAATAAVATGAGVGPHEAADLEDMGSCGGGSSMSSGSGGGSVCCCNLWRPPEDLQQLAFRLLRERIPKGPYLAAHVRRGDFVRVHASTLLGLAEVARFLASKVVDLQLRSIYLASDSKPDDMDHMKHIIAGLAREKGWNITVVAFHDLLKPAGLASADSANSSSTQPQQPKQPLPPPPPPPPPPLPAQQQGEDEGPEALARLVAVEGSMVAVVVDRLLCTEAAVFVATAHSTFSRDIIHARSTDGRTTCADTAVG